MANYHLGVSNISRGKNGSISSRASYIFGEKIRDNHSRKNCYKNRSDVLFRSVFLPEGVPQEYSNVQFLCNEIDRAEKRFDARTAKEFIGSLPNEIPTEEIVQIVTEFITVNFTEHGLAVMAAIHEGRNDKDPSRNNPHVHILVSTRILSKDGFNSKKLRELDRKDNIKMWREHWATLQNRAYERNGLDIRVSHKSLEVQGIKREPIPHISCIDYQREKAGQRTNGGDKRREVIARNKQRLLERERRDREREYDHSRSR